MKFLKVILGLLLIFSSLTAIKVSAEENENNRVNKEVLIYSKEEIKDIKELRMRAKKGITDKEETPVENKSIFLKTDKDPKKQKNIKIDQYQTTQKLKAIKTEKGDTVTSYATTIFLDVPEEIVVENENESEINNTFTAAASRTDDKSDSSYSVRSYSTIYWDEKGSGTTKKFRLTSAKGGWTILDSQVSISNRTVRLGQTYNVTPDYKPSGNTYSYTAPTSWPWLDYNCSACFVGSTSEVTLKRGTSSWKHVFTNNRHGFPQTN